MRSSLLDLLVSQVGLAAQERDHDNHNYIGVQADLASLCSGLVELSL